jgi:ketopantoate hydroxymethyltransferase
MSHFPRTFNSCRARGHVLVSYDVLGLFDAFVPPFAKQYAQGGQQILNAVSHYSEDVRQGVFPSSSVRHDRAPVLVPTMTA